jgi:hypothetical protein
VVGGAIPPLMLTQVRQNLAQLPNLKQEMARMGAPPEARAMYEKAEKVLGGVKVEQMNEAVVIRMVSEENAAERKAMLKSTLGRRCGRSSGGCKRRLHRSPREARI